MSDSSGENYPITDEPTRDSAIGEDGDTEFAADFATDENDVPEQIGDYKILKLIGSGGMGRVYLAEHTRMQRMVAIKMLPVERMADKVAIERFYDEVRAASRLMHPNIVTAFDAGEQDGINYLAMEFIDGVTLTRAVSRKGPLSVGEAASVVRQAALGLLHAHRAGIVHRDVKPGNLMRAADGTVKVLDLGLARITVASLTAQKENAGEAKSGGKLIGTLAFMSPEQLEAPDTADSRSDIYSLGATLYFLLTARPPFTGEYLDQVYGHRHGEIPDLMQERDDVDLGFNNVFQRMMAKSPDERYASLDEVIDDLADYTDNSNTPLWLAEFTSRQTRTDSSTISGDSTTGNTARVFAIDLGMFYAATAEASFSGGINTVPAGGGNRSLFRMALANDNDQLVYGTDAMKLRAENSKNVVHCLPMYIGKPLVEREIAGTQCPPEVLSALLLRKLTANSWTAKSPPQAVAITVPSTYDQFHRQSVLQSAELSGLHSVRLVDRGIAAVQSLLLESDESEYSDSSLHIQTAADKMVLFVGMTGQASEVVVIRRDEARLNQLSTAGHWHTGSLAWLHRLVDIAAEKFVTEHGFDPRESNRLGSQLQVASERAMNSLILLPEAAIAIEKSPGVGKTVTVSREQWLNECRPLMDGLGKTIGVACRRADITIDDIDCCVTLGPLLRIVELRKKLLRSLPKNVTMHSVDRVDVARGAASCLASELPGRPKSVMPPRGVSSQSIGIVVEDIRGRRRILPIIPRGTSLPARTNRRLTVGKNHKTMTLSLVESSGVNGDEWQSLGRYDFEVDASDLATRSRMIGFELNVNGMLSVRTQSASQGSTLMPTLPTPPLDEEQIAHWADWLKSV